MAEIELKNVVKRFGLVTAVDNVNLLVKDREFLVLLGPSGCGKTTVLRLIAGLEMVTQGDIYIAGRKVNNIPPRNRDIAMVFQSYALYPHMNIRENMGFSLRFRKIPKDDVNRQVQEAARILGIENLLDRKPKELSGGQRQRVAMGRAIVRQPQAFLFDEPLSNLDAKLRVQMRAELTRLHRQLERTVVYVTHDQIEAMTLANRIVIMDRGRIMQIGSPMEIYDSPKNMFVAGFIGSPSMNLFNVNVIMENGSLFIDLENHKLTVPRSLQDRFIRAKGQEAVLGIRPEHMFDKSMTSPFPNSEILHVCVDVVEPVGSAAIVIASLGSVQLTASLDPKTIARTQKDLQLLVDMNNIHLFNKKTGEAY